MIDELDVMRYSYLMYNAIEELNSIGIIASSISDTNTSDESRLIYPSTRCDRKN